MLKKINLNKDNDFAAKAHEWIKDTQTASKKKTWDKMSFSEKIMTPMSDRDSFMFTAGRIATVVGMGIGVALLKHFRIIDIKIEKGQEQEAK